MKNLNTARAEITRDWNDCFPSLWAYKPLHLLRRVGPIVTGIVLERDSSGTSYRPTSYVHNLSREFPVITLSLGEYARNERSGYPDVIQVRFHESSYRDCARRLEENALLPYSGDLHLDAVLGAYENYRSRPSTHYPCQIFEDMALIAGWASAQQIAIRIIDDAFGVMRGWPADILNGIGGLDAWLSRLRDRVAHPDHLRATVQEEIEKFKIENAFVSQLYK